MLNGGKCLLTAAAFLADFDVGFGNRSDNKAILACARCFCDLLNERNQVIKGTCREPIHLPELLGVGHKLVNQDDTGATGIKQVLERLTSWGDTSLVGFFDNIKQFRITRFHGKLISHLAPKRIDLAAAKIVVIPRFCRIQCRTNQNSYTADGQLINLSSFEHGFDVADLLARCATTKQMVQRQHTVRFTATKGGLQLNNRFTILASHAAQRLNQQTFHTFGHIGTGEELHRITILVCAFATRNLCQIGGELCVLISTMCHIGVRFDHITPAGQANNRGCFHDTERLFPCASVYTVCGRGHGALSRTVFKSAIQLLDFFLRLHINLAQQ